MATTDYGILFAIFLISLSLILWFLNYKKKTMEEKEQIKENALTTIKETLYNLLCEAEKKWGGGTGLVKRSYVIGLITNSQFYINLPDYIKILVSASTIGTLIDNMVKTQLTPALKSNIDLQAKIGE